jgi:hypothetical protein
MKKIMFCLFVLGIYNLSAYEDFALKFSPLSFGYGINSFEGNNIEINLVTVGFEHKKTGIGIESSAINCYGNNNEISYASFLNLDIYWNILNFDLLRNNLLKIFFGPYSKVNSFIVNKESKHTGKFFDNFIYSAGIRIGLFLDFYSMYWYVINVELGYRNIYRTDNFYFGITVDASWLLYFITKNYKSTPVRRNNRFYG